MSTSELNKSVLIYVRLNLIITALILGGYGLRAFFDPIWAAGSLGLMIDAAGGSTSLRAIYGGWMIGVAILLLVSAYKTERVRFGLLAILCVISPVFLARIYGLLLEQFISTDQFLKLTMEAVSVIITSSLLLRTRNPKNN